MLGQTVDRFSDFMTDCVFSVCFLAGVCIMQLNNIIPPPSHRKINFALRRREIFRRFLLSFVSFFPLLPFIFHVGHSSPSHRSILQNIPLFFLANFLDFILMKNYSFSISYFADKRMHS